MFYTGLFEDYRIAQAILLSCDPKEQKALGRKVKNFDPKVWDAYCKDIVRRGNMAKVRVVMRLYGLLSVN